MRWEQFWAADGEHIRAAPGGRGGGKGKSAESIKGAPTSLPGLGEEGSPQLPLFLGWRAESSFFSFN